MKQATAAHLAALILSFTAPQASLAESANRLVVEATEALTSADFEPDPMAQLMLLRRALAGFDRIVAEHADNPLADQIINGGKVAGTSGPQIQSRIAKLRQQPEICFADPGPNCLTAVAADFSGRFAYLRDQVAAGHAITVAFLARGERTAAQRLIEDLMKSALRIKSTARRVRALIEVVDAQILADDSTGALQTLSHALKAVRTLDSAAQRSRGLSQIAARFIDLRQDTQALDLLQEALSYAPAVKSANAKIEFLTYMSGMFRSLGDQSVAEFLIGSAVETLMQIEDPYDLAWAQIRAARGLRDSGQDGAATGLLEDATESAKGVDVPRIRASLITEIAGLLATWRADNRASELLDNLLNDSLYLEQAVDRREILWWIARTRMTAGHTPSARRALALALDEARGAPLSGRANALSRIAVALTEIGDPQTAQNTVEAAQAAALSLPDGEQRAEALLSVAVALAKMGQGNAGAALLTGVWDAGGYRDPAFARRAGIEPLLIIANALSGPAKIGSSVTPRN